MKTIQPTTKTLICIKPYGKRTHWQRDKRTYYGLELYDMAVLFRLYACFAKPIIKIMRELLLERLSRRHEVWLGLSL